MASQATYQLVKNAALLEFLLSSLLKRLMIAQIYVDDRQLGVQHNERIVD